MQVTTKIAILYDSDTLNILNVGSTCRTIISEYIASYNRKNSITGVDVDLYDELNIRFCISVFVKFTYLMNSLAICNIHCR